MEYYLSGYRVMWIIVMFDLPTITKIEQKKASTFRNSLLDLGFSMTQFSVYMRVCGSKEKMNFLIKVIEGSIPPAGKVHIFAITDKQYGSSIAFIGKSKSKLKNPEQHLLFE